MADDHKRSISQPLRSWARQVKRDVHALYLASRHPHVPWYAKLLAVLIVAYALSPIDLIPDFIPVLGYLDDVVIVPLGILLVIRLIPPEILADCRANAEIAARAPASRVAAAVIVLLWMLMLLLALIWIADYLGGLTRFW
jgi:uncharacterized membrane protein YkvA (DUF1232 family)